MATAINSIALHWADILVLVAYFAIVIGFGIWVSTIEIVTLKVEYFMRSTIDYLILSVNIYIYFSHHVKIVVVLVCIDHC
jgi:hypothetical protein